jgi:hypothetical protein
MRNQERRKVRHHDGSRRRVVSLEADKILKGIRAKTMKNIIPRILALVLLALSGRAQTYSIDWHKIAGGGGTGTNGQYSLSGTVGQHDAGGPMNGPGLSLSGGFWTVFAEQSPGAPLVSIKMTDANTVKVYWPSPSPGFHLQVSTDLSSSNWNDPSETVNDDGTNKYILITGPVGNAYYRLKSP